MCKLPTLSSFCACCPLKVGAIILGTIYILFGILQTLGIGILLILDDGALHYLHNHRVFEFSSKTDWASSSLGHSEELIAGTVIIIIGLLHITFGAIGVIDVSRRTPA